MQNLGGLAKNLYIGDMATAVFSEIAGHKNAGRGLFAETTASHVRHNNNFINNYRYTPTYYYLQDKMGKTDSKRYYFGKLSVAPNVDGIGIGHAYTTDIDEHAFNMGFVSSPDFEDFQTQLGELLLSKSRDENYYKNLLNKSEISSIDSQFIASGITELNRNDRYKVPEEKDILNPDEHGDIKSLYKKEQENTIYSGIARENYMEFHISGKTINKWDDVKISYNVDNINKGHHEGLSDYSATTSGQDIVRIWVNTLYSNANEKISENTKIEDYFNHKTLKDYDNLTESTDFYVIPTEIDVDEKYYNMARGHESLFDLYRDFRYKSLTSMVKSINGSGNTSSGYSSVFKYYKHPLLVISGTVKGNKAFVGQIEDSDKIDSYSYTEEGRYTPVKNFDVDSGIWIDDSDVLLTDIKGSSSLSGKFYAEAGVNDINVVESGGSYSPLIQYTNNLFNKIKIRSIVNRYNTNDKIGIYKEDELVTSYNKNGLSRGRNLALKDEECNGCRVWTKVKQYSKVTDLIRPITTINTSGKTIFKPISDIQRDYGELRPNEGATRLDNNTVLQSNGFVKITPTHNEDGSYDNIKNYMFSIENLAWKDVKDSELSQEQKGPKGGRIMWFPPYNLKFSENVNVNWNGNSFIGRGEQIYTYTNTERSGTLDFTLLIDHPSILNKWRRIGEIEEKEKKEMELLRYFAGCGDLEIKTLQERLMDWGIKALEKTLEHTRREKYTKTESMGVLLFFPNAYTYTKDEGGAINVEETIKTLKTYECQNIIGDFTSSLNVNSSSNNEQSFLWLNDFNALPSINNSGSTYYSEIKEIDFKNYFPEVTNDNEISVVINKYFVDGEPRFKTFLETSAEHKQYQEHPSDSDSPYVYRSSGDSGYKYWVKSSNTTRDSVVANFNGITTPLMEENTNLYSFKEMVERNPFKSNTSEKIHITKIKFGGTATSLGSDKNIDNDTLAKDRAHTIRSIFENKCGKDFGGECEKEEETKVVVVDGEDINHIKHKLGRIGYIVVQYEITESLTRSQAKKQGYVTSSNVTTDNNEEPTKETTRIRSVYTYKSNDPYTYDNEFLYFSNLKNNDNFIYKNIVDKVKFFDPAFHSMTPEGFNSRLSFLHQCTRQGPTAKVNNTDFAGNLAFGRAPYCILRIGDFFNTKICIDSMSIQYDNGGGVQWDLNPEGIGVQPMYATVSLNFKFIGGQDISGPIERLQNAVTSNYYANTSIYDQRADYITKEGDISTYIIEKNNE